MAVYHQFLTIVRPAGTAFEPSAEGCFVTLDSPFVQLATATTKPADVYGLLTDVAEEEGMNCTIATPGFSGTVGVRLAADAKDGDQLALAEGGAVVPAKDGNTVVAVALADGVSGKLVEARLVQPYAASGIAAQALSATVAVISKASTKNTTSTK